MLDDVKGSSLHLEDIGGNLDKENLCETECSFWELLLFPACL